MAAYKHENPMAVRSKNSFAKALLTLMMKKPFDEITISDISQESGLARQTFYSNFAKKEAILTYLLSEFFDRYRRHILSLAEFPENIMVDYFIFWNEHIDFLKLLFRQNLGYLFCDYNRKFFTQDLPNPENYFSAEPWLIPYTTAGLAGMTFELLQLWISQDQGLSIAVLNTLTANFTSGRIFGESVPVGDT